MNSARNKNPEPFPTRRDHDSYRELFMFFRGVDYPGEYFDQQCELAALHARFEEGGFGVDPLPW